jgi:predicted nucleotidyltransferase
MTETESSVSLRSGPERPFDVRLWRTLERQKAEVRERRRRETLARVKEGVRTCLAGRPGIHAYLFGSLLQPGAFGVRSDVDVAVEGVPALEYFALLGDLEERLGTERVDLIELERCVFADLVRQQGERVQ